MKKKYLELAKIKKIVILSCMDQELKKYYEEVSKIFPSNKVEIFSSDYMKKKDQTKSLFSRIMNNKVDILDWYTNDIKGI